MLFLISQKKKSPELKWKIYNSAFKSKMNILISFFEKWSF